MCIALVSRTGLGNRKRSGKISQKVLAAQAKVLSGGEEFRLLKKIKTEAPV